MNSTILASLFTLTIAPLASAQCVGDIVVDRRVDGGDLGTLLANWGSLTSTSVSRSCDLDGNGIVNGADLGMLLANWGPCPIPAWGNVIQAQPDANVVTDPSLRAAIQATGLPWRVVDKGTGIEMVLVPPGTFQMGCSMGSNACGCFSYEQPVHAVTLTNSFYMGRYELTQAQWKATMGSNPSYFQAQTDSPLRPVEQVSWTAVQNYLSATGMRLPTEAEWEYACRAGTQAPFYNGLADDATVANLAWYSANSGSQTHAVGGKVSNGFGLHDMLGNVWEWVSDWYANFPSTDQVDPTGPVRASFRVLRGGSWPNDTSLVRSPARTDCPQNSAYNEIGFRVARNP